MKTSLIIYVFPYLFAMMWLMKRGFLVPIVLKNVAAHEDNHPETPVWVRDYLSFFFLDISRLAERVKGVVTSDRIGCQYHDILACFWVPCSLWAFSLGSLFSPPKYSTCFMIYQ